jgi:NAD+ kinase
MPNEFKRIGLWGRFSEGNVAEPANQLAAHLIGRGIEVFAGDAQGMLKSSNDIRYLPLPELGGAIDLLVAIGGDGNLLRATRCVAGGRVPLIGINRGRLGFLTDVKPNQMLAAIDAMLDGDYLAEDRILLEARIHGPDGAPASHNALNDVVLQKVASGRILDFETSVDGLYVNRHGGDGLIVATPTGSTAYALSCGGPIIRPDVAALVMIPICPHTLSDRPIVIQSSSRVSVTVPPGGESRALVTCDGEELGFLDPDMRLEIGTAKETVRLLHPKDYNYYDLLRSKLHWGRNTRSES